MIGEMLHSCKLRQKSSWSSSTKSALNNERTEIAEVNYERNAASNIIIHSCAETVTSAETVPLEFITVLKRPLQSLFLHIVRDGKFNTNVQVERTTEQILTYPQTSKPRMYSSALKRKINKTTEAIIPNRSSKIDCHTNKASWLVTQCWHKFCGRCPGKLSLDHSCLFESSVRTDSATNIC